MAIFAVHRSRLSIAGNSSSNDGNWDDNDDRGGGGGGGSGGRSEETGAKLPTPFGQMELNIGKVLPHAGSTRSPYEVALHARWSLASCLPIRPPVRPLARLLVRRGLLDDRTNRRTGKEKPTKRKGVTFDVAEPFGSWLANFASDSCATVRRSDGCRFSSEDTSFPDELWHESSFR